MISLTVKARYHWGFWVRMPTMSKFQATLPIPPPTTIIGALAYPLIRNGVLSVDGVRLEGELLFDPEAGVMSPAGLLEKYVHAAARFDPIAVRGGMALGYVWDDINKYVTLLFQEFTRLTEEEKHVGGRRYLMRYRTGALPTGKVYYPSGISIVILVDEAMRSIVDGDLEKELVKAAWQMVRVGSKESIVSVEDVTVSKARPLGNRRVKTSYYFPVRAGAVEEGDFYSVAFWRGGWSRSRVAGYEEYVIPGSKMPLSPGEVTVALLDKGQAFDVNGEVVIVYG